MFGSRKGSLRDFSRGRRKFLTSSAEASPLRLSRRAMHSQPQISFHGTALPFSSSVGAKIHRLCRVKVLSGFVSTSFSSTRLCTAHFNRSGVSDNDRLVRVPQRLVTLIIRESSLAAGEHTLPLFTCRKPFIVRNSLNRLLFETDRRVKIACFGVSYRQHGNIVC